MAEKSLETTLGKGYSDHLNSMAANTGQRVMQAARDAFAALAQRRGER